MAVNLDSIKQALRITHTKLDEDIRADIDACLADLRLCGIVHAADDDPLILAEVKLWCRSLYTDDPAKGAEYLRRYEAMKACLQMAEGYGWTEEAGADD